MPDGTAPKASTACPHTLPGSPARRLSVALLLLFLHAITATAQVTLDTTVVLPGVTVTATRHATSAARAPAHVGIIGRAAIGATASQDVAELLEARSALFLKRYGGGGVATLSLRGTTAAQTLVLLDGYRIADPQLGELDISLLPTVLLESVEVMHGAASSLYGTDGVGGVVNLRTLAAGPAPRARVSAGYGAYGDRSAGLVLSGGQGRFSGVAAFEVATAEGDFPYLNEALFPARVVRRAGADRLRRSWYASLRYAAPRHDLRLSGWYNDAERGLPGLATRQPLGERLWDEHLRLWAEDRLRLGRASLRLGGLVQRAALRYTNPQLDLDDTGRTLVSSAEAEISMPAGHRWLLAGGLAGGYGTARHPDLAEATDLNGAIFLHATGRFGRLLVYPALRADLYASSPGVQRTVLSPRLGVNLQLLEGRRLYLKAGAGRAFRAPTFNERFWMPGGNPAIRPEHGWTADAGLYAQRRRGRLEISAFAGRTFDQIMWVPTPAGHHGAVNLASVQRRGVEAAWHREWLPQAGRLLTGLIYTFVDARDRSDPTSGSYGRPLRYVPRDQLKVYAGTRIGPFLLDLDGRYAGRRYVTTDATQYVDPYVILDARVRLQVPVAGLRTQLTLSIDNLLNTRYAVVQHYPMPPRHATLHLLIETGPTSK